MFNDNGDGTLSVVRLANLKRSIVVSKDVRAPEMLEPLAEPQQPSYVIDGKTGIAGMLVSADAQPTVTPVPPPVVSGPVAVKPSSTLEDNPYQDLPVPIEGNRLKMWDFVTPHLVRTNKNVIPDRGWVPQVVGLPRVRDLRWNPAWIAKNGYIDAHPRDISSLIIQVTGERAPEPCTKCLEGKGPYKGCVIISREAPKDAQAAIVSCANCFYHLGQTYCSHQAFMRARFQSLFPAQSVEQMRKDTYSPRVAQNAASNNASLSPSRNQEAGPGQVIYGRRPRSEVPTYNLAKLSAMAKRGVPRGSEASSLVAEDQESPAPRRSERSVTKELPTATTPAAAEPDKLVWSTASLSRPSLPQSQPHQHSSGAVAAASSSSALVSTGQLQRLGAEILEMEDWEVAPGRVRNASLDEPESKSCPSHPLLDKLPTSRKPPLDLNH